MRLSLSFLTLLLVATLAAGLEMKDFGAARGGDPLARLVVFASAPVALAAIAVLTRIVVKVDAARRTAGRS